MIPRKKIRLFFYTFFIFHAFVNGKQTPTDDNESGNEYDRSSMNSVKYRNTTPSTNYTSSDYSTSKDLTPTDDKESGDEYDRSSMNSVEYRNTTPSTNYTSSDYSTSKDLTTTDDKESGDEYDRISMNSVEYRNTTPSTNYTSSDYSTPKDLTTTEAECRDPPDSVQNLRVSNKSYDSITVTWTYETSIDCISYFRVEYSDGNFNESVDTDDPDLEYVISDLTPCTTYSIWVIAVSNTENVSTAENVSATTEEALPGVISALTVQEITGYSVHLTWLAPTENADCVSNYTIEICDQNDCTTNFTTDLFYNATNLSPCLFYEFTVGAVGTAGSAETLSRTANTSYVVPGEPSSLGATPGQFSLDVYWDPPSIGATCITSYRITLWEDGTTHTTQNTNVTFSNLYACKEYTAQVTPVSGSSDGILGKITATVKPSVEDPPVPDIEPTVTKDTITFAWRIERNSNNCPLKTVLTTCNFTGTDGQGIDERNGKSEVDISSINSNAGFTTNITVVDLSPFSYYTCYGYTQNSAGYSQGSMVTTRTSEDVPSAPIMTTSNVTSTTLVFGWSKPEYLAGNLVEHEIIFSSYQRFLTPASCEYVNSGSISNIDGVTREYFYSDAIPYSTYNAKIRARTNAGWGSYSDDITFETQAGVPGVVRNLVYSNPASADNANVLDTFLSWELPCSLNGELEHFIITVHGTRKNFNDHEMNIEKTYDENITADHRFLHNFGELKAEYNYTFKIFTKVADVSEHGTYTSYDVTYPAGIPPMPDGDYMEAITIDEYKAERTTTTATVLLPLFKNTNGEIRYYAVMISRRGYHIHSSSRLDIWNGSWPNVHTWKQSSATDFNITYQATQSRWDPNATNHIQRWGNFKVVQFTLGEDETCSKSSIEGSYCNGPLLPDTVYQIRMRAFTFGGYSDSVVFVVRTKAELDVGLVIGVVFGILFLGIITTMMLLVRKGGLRAIIRNAGAQTSPVPDPLTRKKFELHCQDLIENPGKLSNEFQLLHTLSVDLQMSTNDALLQANKKKNRYLDILPYDISRVKLDLVDNDPNTDYINASFVHGYTGAVEYIACQGPKEETTYDFWRMIFQYNIKVIVMVTQLVEKGKEKCHQYYPNMRENFEYEDITIRCSTQLDFVFYTQRNIILQMEDVKRTVTHLHFKEWSDHGVPDDFHSMIHFCQAVRKQMNDNKGIAVVHCSAGVGRTGTLITVDILLQHIRDNKRLDVFGTVFNLRKDRINMVQTESQYAYIYNCTRQALNNPYPLKQYKSPSVDPIYDTLPIKRKEITDSNTNLVNSAETLKKISPSSSIDSMEPIYEVVRQRPSYDTQLSTLSNGLRYTKSTGAINQPISEGAEIVRYGSHKYPIFEPAPDTLSNRSSIDKNTSLKFTRPSRARLE